MTPDKRTGKINNSGASTLQTADILPVNAFPKMTYHNVTNVSAISNVVLRHC